MTTEDSGFTAEQLAAIHGEHTPPAWLNPTHLPPADLVARIDAAIEQVGTVARTVYDVMLDHVRPVEADYRAWMRDHPVPADADEAVDQIAHYDRLDNLLNSLYQFVQFAHERLDDVPVYEAFGRVLQGDPRSVYQQAEHPRRGGQ